MSVIGSLVPGQALDVTGTVRTVGFTMSSTSPISGYVLTATDSAGDASWQRREQSAGGQRLVMMFMKPAAGMWVLAQHLLGELVRLL